MALFYPILVMHLLYLLINVSVASANTGVYFNYNSTSGWKNNINIAGATSINDSILELTGANPNSNCSWATYRNPIPLVDNVTGMPASFSTHFTFFIKKKGATSGDGLAFFLSPYPLPQSSDTCGGYFGLFPSDSITDSLQNQVVAVEIDTYRNSWDPEISHVGIDVNSIYSVVYKKLKDNIMSGTRTKVWVSYSADDQTLNVSLNDENSPAPGKPDLSYKVNLTQVLPKTVAVGFSAVSGAATEIHQILSWEFLTTFGSSTSTPLKPKPKYIPLVLVLVLCAIGVTLFLGGFGWFLVWRKKSLKKRGDNRDLPTKYSYKELVRATSNFASKNKLGEGGFGPVFKGYLRDSCDEVAVKQLKQGSNQGLKEFNTEVETLSKLRHPNLVGLFGWCEENGELLLVYKYMPNGSLNSLLYDNHRLLLWPKRYEIVINLADALCYLHTENEHNKIVVHRDIKPDNVLLDSSLNAKLGDFGLARQVGHGLSPKTTDAIGTRGYVAPELYINDGRSKPSTQSDIYSFGVVLLEIACGRIPFDLDLIRFVWEHYGRNELLNAADERLRGEYDAKEIERVMFVGLWCSHPVASERPTIGLARSALMFEDCVLPVLPQSKPLYPPLLSGRVSGGSSTPNLSNSTGTSMWSSQEVVV